MRTLVTFGSLAALFLTLAVSANAQDKVRKIGVTLTVPSSAYKIKIKEIYQTKTELWVLSQVKGGGIGLTVISKVKDSVKVKAPDLKIKHFIVGKNWNWTKEKYTYVKNAKQFQRMVAKANATRVWTRKKKDK